MKNTIEINYKKCSFEQGETILQIAKRNKIHIPTLCHLADTIPTGACRICLVEVNTIRGPVASCSTPAANGMIIFTETKKIIEARKLVIELLLISGNHNCAVRGKKPNEWSDFNEEVKDYDQARDICVKYGECELQALAYKYMVTQRTIDRIPTNYAHEGNDPLISRDFSRCILCGRCVQACTEVQVNNAVSHGYRGNVAKIVHRGDKTLPDSECVHCGECIQVCPVGALYEKRDRFNKRMWNIQKHPSTCYYCGVGCQLSLFVNKGKIVKVEGREEAEPNNGRLCVKGRFAYDFIDSDKRLKTPLLKKDKEYVEITWKKALEIFENKLDDVINKSGPESIVCLASPKQTNEDMFAAKYFFQKLNCQNVIHSEPFSYFGIEYGNILNYETIVIINNDINMTNPVAASYIKQAKLKGTKIITIFCDDSEIAKHSSVNIKNFDQLNNEVKGKTLIIHDPYFDKKLIPKEVHAEIFSIGKENNTLGLYLNNLPAKETNSEKYRLIYSMSGIVEKTKSNDFVVLQKVFRDNEYGDSDLILPVAVWVEYEGSYTSSDSRINLVQKILNPPGEALPTWEIFQKLALKMNLNWDYNSAKEIWENGILEGKGEEQNLNYHNLLKKGTKISIPVSDNNILRIAGKKIKKMNNHRTFSLHCKGLKEIAERRIKDEV